MGHMCLVSQQVVNGQSGVDTILAVVLSSRNMHNMHIVLASSLASSSSGGGSGGSTTVKHSLH